LRKDHRLKISFIFLLVEILRPGGQTSGGIAATPFQKGAKEAAKATVYAATC